MKIKEVIAQTGLTDRAIRLYIANGLVSPTIDESYAGRRSIDFSPEDTALLQKIAVLRKAGFSLGQIRDVRTGGEAAKSAVEAFLAEKTEERKHTDAVLSALSCLPPDEIPTMESLCHYLTRRLEDTPVPQEDLKPTKGERIEKIILRIFAIVPLVILGGFYLLTRIGIGMEFRYAKFISSALAPIAYPALLLSLVPGIVILILYRARTFTVKKRRRRRCISILLCVVNFFTFFIGLWGIAGINFSCPFASMTEDPANYLQLDDYVNYFKKDQIYDLFPLSIPNSAIGEGNYWSGHSYPETTQYYYRYAHDIEVDYEINAQWVLPEEEYVAEKERILAWQTPKAQAEQGDWICWHFGYNIDDTIDDVIDGGCGYYLIFAFNDKTHMVRYIIFSSIEILTPHFTTLDW